MIFEFNGGKSVHFKKSSITETFLVLCDGESIPDVAIMNNIVIGVQGKMIEDSLPKMCCARQKILCEILWDACDTRTFDGIVSGKQSIVRRQQVDIKLTIDEPANVMQNMCGRALWAGHDIEGCIKNSFHCSNYKLGDRT